MKPQARYGLIVLGILALLAGIGVVFFKPPAPGLYIADADSGMVYGSWILQEGDTFTIAFIHSVNNSPVMETFMVAGNEIRPIASRFASFGAGIQAELEEGQVLSREGEFLLLTGFRTSYKELHYIVGTVSDHLLYIQHETLSLRALCGKNTPIRIRIKR